MGHELEKTDTTRNNIWKLWVGQGILKTTPSQAVCKSTVYSKQPAKQHWERCCTAYLSNKMPLAFTRNHKRTGSSRLLSQLAHLGPVLSGRCCSPFADNGFRASINTLELFSAPFQQGWPCLVWKRFQHCLHQCSSCFHHLHSCINIWKQAQMKQATTTSQWQEQSLRLLISSMFIGLGWAWWRRRRGLCEKKANAGVNASFPGMDI